MWTWTTESQQKPLCIIKVVLRVKHFWSENFLLYAPIPTEFVGIASDILFAATGLFLKSSRKISYHRAGSRSEDTANTPSPSWSHWEGWPSLQPALAPTACPPEKHGRSSNLSLALLCRLEFWIRKKMTKKKRSEEKIATTFPIWTAGKISASALARSSLFSWT